MTTVDGGCERTVEIARTRIADSLECCDAPDPQVMYVETYPDAEKWEAPGYCDNCWEHFLAKLIMHTVEVDTQ